MRIFFLTCFFLTISLIGFTQIQLVSTTKKDSIEHYISYLEKQNELIGSISICENGQRSFKKDFGQLANGTTEQIQESIKYQVGSISKLFTAVMLAQLQDNGQINFEEPLSNYFKEMPNSSNISLRQMLNHTSGMKDYVIKNDTSFYWLLKARTEQEILQEIKRQGVLFDPGDSISYSNSAYYLLARILEKKYKMDYDKILKKQIVEPLGLKNTSASSRLYPYPAGVNSYKKVSDVWEKIDDFDFVNASGVGDIVSTTDDLNIFISALYAGKIVKTSTLKNMQPNEKKWFGLGVMTVPFYEHIGFGHGGDTYGTHSVISIFPKENLSIAYCVNGESYLTNNFAKDVLSILFDKKFDYPKFSKLVADTNSFSTLIGIYGSKDFPLNLKIFKDGDLLKAQGDGQPSFALTATSLNTYEFKQAQISIQFNLENNSLTFTQAGKSFELLKKVDELIVPSSETTIFKNGLYEGQYKTNDFPLAIRIFSDAGALKAQADGQSAFMLTKISENKFEFKEAGIVITFNSNDKTMLLFQQGKEYIFKKQ